MLTAWPSGEFGIRSAGTIVIARNEAISNYDTPLFAWDCFSTIEMTFVADYKVNGKQSVKAKKMLTAWPSGEFGVRSAGTIVIARYEAISSYISH
jgi:hypothetical protein